MHKTKQIIGIALLLSALTPGIASATWNENRGDDKDKKAEKHVVAQLKHEAKQHKKEEKREDKTQKECLNANSRWGWFWGRHVSKECRELRLSLWKQFIAEYRQNHPATTTPDTVAPTLSSIVISGITNTSASINWTTNENATGKIYYATTSPASTSSPLSTGTASLSLAHPFTLTGLSGNTTYYFIVESKDAAGNTVRSGQHSFATAVNPDATAPTLSAITISNLASTSVTVSWTTNENASGKIFYGTTTPLATASAPFQSTASLTTNHSFTLTGLSTSTQYFFAVESKDATNNAATSSESSFTTNAN